MIDAAAGSVASKTLELHAQAALFASIQFDTMGEDGTAAVGLVRVQVAENVRYGDLSFPSRLVVVDS
jgi:hypothetical protein